MKMLLAVILGAALVGCATVPPVTEADRTRTYSGPYEQVFDIVKLALIDMDCEIMVADRDAGLIKAVDQVMGGEWTEVLVGKSSGIHHYFTVNFLRGEKTKVVAGIHLAYGDGTHRSEADQFWYTKLWDTVRAHL